MAWQDEIIPIVRVLINDNSSPYTYSDTRLEEAIVVAAQIMIREISFDKTYTITISTTTITPDPIDDPRDDAFITLTALKTACFIFDGETRTAGLQSFSITDGPSTVSTASRYSAAKDNSRLALDAFGRAKLAYLSGNSIGAGVVMTPYTTQNAYIQQTNIGE